MRVFITFCGCSHKPFAAYALNLLPSGAQIRTGDILEESPKEQRGKLSCMEKMLTKTQNESIHPWMKGHRQQRSATILCLSNNWNKFNQWVHESCNEINLGPYFIGWNVMHDLLSIRASWVKAWLRIYTSCAHNKVSYTFLSLHKFDPLSFKISYNEQYIVYPHEVLSWNKTSIYQMVFDWRFHWALAVIFFEPHEIL